MRANEINVRHVAGDVSPTTEPTTPRRRDALRWLGLGAIGSPWALAACGGGEASDAADTTSTAAPTASDDSSASSLTDKPSPMTGRSGAQLLKSFAAPWAMGGNVSCHDWAPSPFVDVVKSSRGFGRPNEWTESFTIARDAQGWPLEPSRIVITAVADRPGTDWPTGVWKGRYRGTGNIRQATVAGSRVENIVRRRDVVTFDWVVTATPFLGLEFDGPIRDLRIVRPGYSLDNHPLLHPQALDHYKQFHTLRFLEFMGQNDTEDQAESTWAQRQPAGKFHGRKSWDAMAQFFTAVFEAPDSKLCGIWWNVPYRFAERDCLLLGRLLQRNLPATALKFPEFSNELWNAGYVGKWNHFKTRADNPADPDYARIDTPTAPDEWYRLARLWALTSARMARAMKEAFPGEFGLTLHPVMATHFQNPEWLSLRGLPWLEDRAQTRQFGLPSSYVGTLAAAPYISGTLEEMDAAADAQTLLDGLRDGYRESLAQVVSRMPAWPAMKARFGIARMDTYEFQLHTHGSQNLQVKYDASLDPEAGTLVTDLSHALRDGGFRTLCYWNVSPQVANVNDINSFAWSVTTDWSLASTAKGRALAGLIAETGQ
jgi:hypothetical protein